MASPRSALHPSWKLYLLSTTSETLDWPDFLLDQTSISPSRLYRNVSRVVVVEVVDMRVFHTYQVQMSFLVVHTLRYFTDDSYVYSARRGVNGVTFRNVVHGVLNGNRFYRVV